MKPPRVPARGILAKMSESNISVVKTLHKRSKRVERYVKNPKFDNLYDNAGIALHSEKYELTMR